MWTRTRLKGRDERMWRDVGQAAILMIAVLMPLIQIPPLLIA